MSDRDALILRCPAKVNLALSVGAPRADGYHPIASWMVTVDLCDQLTLRRADASRYDIGWADDAPQPSAIDWPIESDLIVKAHRLVERHIGRSLPINAKLAKSIPVGAGLAGGSSDAAGVLKGLNQLFDLKLPRQVLIDLAMQLGSDIAFFFTAGSAIVTGRGEALAEAPLRQPLHLVLILPPLHCATGAVYRSFDQMRPNAAVDESAVRDVHAGRREPFNDLADPAMEVEPRLADLKSQISDSVSAPVHITGSGAGMFIVARDTDEAEAIRSQVVDAVDAPIILASHRQ